MAAKIVVRGLSFYYDGEQALEDISFDIPEGVVTSIMGPDSSGKSTLLRALNRMNDPIPHHEVAGKVMLDGEDIYSKAFDPIELRRRVGMVFRATGNYADDIYGELSVRLRNMGLKKDREIRARVEDGLRDAMLWDELADKLERPPDTLSEIQSHKMCVARTLVNQPEVLLMDEPLLSLEKNDSKSMMDLIHNLRGRYTIVVATRSTALAEKADCTAVLDSGKLVEFRSRS